LEAERLQEILLRFRECRIAVLGDFFLDRYLDVDPMLAEISLETGKVAHQVISIRCSPGAAGTVVNNLAALGTGSLHAVGFAGDDGEGFELRRGLRDLGCETQGLQILPDRFTPTYSKPRDCRTAGLSGEHERYDTKNRRPTPEVVQERALSHLEKLLPGLDAVIIMDQVEEEECGMVTARMRQALADLAEHDPRKVFWADSRNRIGLFRNVTIKANEREAVAEIFPELKDTLPDGIVEEAIAQLRSRTGKPVFVTAGRRGIWVSDPSPARVRGVNINEPTDPTGAGDSATAGAVLALCAGATLHEAALVANLVASITVQQLATTGTARPDQIGPRLAMWLSQA
jgi:bifunctional ADP-heptose synthase (sugar kinase/adenylyltransferase)